MAETSDDQIGEIDLQGAFISGILVRFAGKLRDAGTTLEPHEFSDLVVDHTLAILEGIERYREQPAAVKSAAGAGHQST